MIVDEKGIKYSWKKYMEKLTNKENEWDHGISAGVKEGPADCNRIEDFPDNDVKWKPQSMKWRVPNQQVDQRGLGERLCKKAEQGGCCGS